jgi:hypothetical protein
LHKHFIDNPCPAGAYEKYWKACKKIVQAKLFDKMEKNLGLASLSLSYIGNYVFDRTGAVCLTGSNTVVRVTFYFRDKKLVNVVPEIRPVGDGTVSLASQKMHVDARNVKEVNAPVDHGDPFTEKGKAVGIFKDICDLMDQFFNEFLQARQRATQAALAQTGQQS